MEKITEEINRFSGNKYDFILKSALLDRSADFCVIEFLYKDGVILDLKEKKQIEEFAISILPKNFVYEFRFIKRYINVDRIFDDTTDYLTKNFPSLSFKIESVMLENNVFKILVLIDEMAYLHAKEQKVSSKLEEYLKLQYNNFDYVCTIEKSQVFVEDEKEKLIKDYYEEQCDIYAKRKIEFFDVVPLVGEFLDDEKADYIKDKTKPEENIVICGTIESIQEKVIKRKPKNNKNDIDNKIEAENNQAYEDKQVENLEGEKNANSAPDRQDGLEVKDEENQTKYQRKLYKFTLSDFTGNMNCVFFSNKENQAKLEKLGKGSVVVVRGTLEEDSYSGGNTLKVKDLAYCSLPDNKTEYIEFRTEKPFYEFVEPEKIVTFTQDNLLNFSEEKTTPKFLQNKTFVCYDFETTGLHYSSGDRIIEIGAVKIENGKITEKFMSFVDPEKHIPEESSAISGIVDSDVFGAPTADKVLQDFYKWTRGAIIIGYNNINFDNLFLIGQGKEARWNFDNETDDVYKWAQKYVRGAKNYKLKTIADKLGVTLDNAHRAVYDALATAEVFIKIQEIYQNDIEKSLNL